MTWPERAVELGTLARGVTQLDQAARQPAETVAVVDRACLIAVLAFCHGAATDHDTTWR